MQTASKHVRIPWMRSVMFVALLAALIVSVDRILMAGLRLRRTGDLGVWNRVVRGEVGADLLITGSSRSLVDLDSEVIESLTGMKSFNIGLAGSPLQLQLPWLKTYLKYNRQPKVILQSLDMWSLGTAAFVYQPEQYVPYLREDCIYETVAALDPMFRKYRYVPLYSFAILKMNTRRAMVALLGLENPAREFRVAGQWRVPDAWRDWEFAEFMRLYPEGEVVGINEEGIAILRSLVALAKDRNIDLILVYPPEYCEAHPFIKNRSEIFAMFRAISDECGVPFWDYSDHPISGSKAWFFNSQHLNEKGAVEFSRDVAGRLKERFGRGVRQP